VRVGNSRSIRVATCRHPFRHWTTGFIESPAARAHESCRATGQDMYSTWIYTLIVPLDEIEYLHHFADKDGRCVNPQQQGLPPDMPSEVRNLVTLKAAGDNKTAMTVTEFDWPEGELMEMSKMGMEQCLARWRPV
jgi:hypothetical protein